MDSEISGQNSLTMLSNLRNAKIFNSGIGSSKRAITPAEMQYKIPLKNNTKIKYSAAHNLNQRR